MTDCTQNRDPLKLVREGTNQEQRLSPALDPAYAPVNERNPAHGMVFAQAYAAFLKYYNSNNIAEGDWKPFFSEDVSVRLAVAAVQDMAFYKSNVNEYFDFLNNLDNESNEVGLKDRLGYLFSCAATLANQLDVLKEGLPIEIPLKGALQNRIQSQLAPAFKKLILYYRDGLSPDPSPPPVAPYHNDVKPTFAIMGTTRTFKDVREQGLSKDWIAADDASQWSDYLVHLDDLLKYPSTQIYGSGVTVFERINHIATHNLFTSVFDLFLKVYAGTVNEAERALEATLAKWDRHEPHYALFLAYLQLFEYARTEMNTLTGRHLDFYYREILRLKEKAAESGKAHLLVELAKQAPTHLFKAGELFKAGKDDLGNAAFFANDRDFVANQAKVAALKTVYRHGDQKVGIEAPTDKHEGRLYASPVANSENGPGAELTSVDQSWHPFYNKIYQDGVLSKIDMPQAEIGFAIASHYLWMAEGSRWVWVEINVNGYSGAILEDLKNKITCGLTSEKGWIEKDPVLFFPISANTFWLLIEIRGSDASVTPYLAKTHGYNFGTDLPVLLVKLKHEATDAYTYSIFQDIIVKNINLQVFVSNLKTLAVSNDFGPVDTSKPFQPYGASPVANNAWVIGAKEVFQKKLVFAMVGATWLTTPTPYQTSPLVNIDFLTAGQWLPSNIPAIGVGSTAYNFTNILDWPVVDEPDLTPNEFYNTTSRHGFARLKLSSSFGQSQYQADLFKYLRKESNATDPGQPPVGPSMSALWMNYSASQTIPLDSTDADGFNDRNARFFHLAPFGQAEQHPVLSSAQKVYLLPQFDFQRDDANNESEAELYIGVTGLQPPQNLNLLFQVADGTADPLSVKPDPHIHWSYLRGNAWIPFPENDVEDRTGGLLNSGIISFAIPRDASDTNTLLPSGMHWIRGAVASESDAVCRLLMIAAQGLDAAFTDRGNDPAFPAKVLPSDTIKKLDQPDAAVKKISQPFATFGGRGAEAPTAFYTRISERLRHKDRAIALWGYERLVLEAFPQIFKAKCLNHTHYEPNESGAGIYRELAPGHVTVVTIPNQQFQNLRDPLRPYTSLGLLLEIDAFLHKRLSCFVKLHVKNPQFEEVWVDFKVRLYDGLDEAFYVSKLQEDITRFLSPWAFPGGGNPSFGGKVYKSVLINFVEDQLYVDYVTDFQLFHGFHDIDGAPQTVEKNEVEGSKAVSIMVSVPAKKHIIQVIKPAEEETPGEKCPCEA